MSSRTITKVPGTRTRSHRRWEKPGYGEHELKTNVPVNPNGSKGLGFVLRDQNGDVVLARKTEVRAMGNSDLLEGLAKFNSVILYRKFSSPKIKTKYC